MTVGSPQQIEMQIHLGVLGDAAEKVRDELDVEVADTRRRNGGVPDEGHAPGKIEAATRQRLIHGDVIETITLDTLLVARRLQQCFTQANGDVLGAVVHVHVYVAVAFYRKAEASVLAQQVEHVIQKA